MLGGGGAPSLFQFACLACDPDDAGWKGRSCPDAGTTPKPNIIVSIAGVMIHSTFRSGIDLSFRIGRWAAAEAAAR